VAKKDEGDFQDPHPELVTDDGDLPKLANFTDLDEMEYEDFVKRLHYERIEQIDFEGSPWTLIDKSKLVDTPFVIAGVNLNRGTKSPKGFVSVRIFRLEDKKRFVFNDGSTGVRDQVLSFANRNGSNAMVGKVCRNGLRVSQYPYVDPETGKESTAETYYLA
jgi:hypothetical protein